jgi:hypothetical protein
MKTKKLSRKLRQNTARNITSNLMLRNIHENWIWTQLLYKIFFFFSHIARTKYKKKFTLLSTRDSQHRNESVAYIEKENFLTNSTNKFSQNERIFSHFLSQQEFLFSVRENCRKNWRKYKVFFLRGKNSALAEIIIHISLTFYWFLKNFKCIYIIKIVHVSCQATK